MVKIAKLLIALIVVSMGFLSGCNEKENTKIEEETEELNEDPAIEDDIKNWTKEYAEKRKLIMTAISKMSNYGNICTCENKSEHFDHIWYGYGPPVIYRYCLKCGAYQEISTIKELLEVIDRRFWLDE